MRSIVMAAVLVGCGPSSALEIVVELPPQREVDRVQLYLGLGAAVNGSVERLVPRDYAYPDVPDGFYWRRDPNGAADVIAVAPGASEVRFVFQEGTDDQVTAIVVGFREDRVVAAGSLVDAYLDAGSVRQYHVALQPASAAFPRPAPTPVTVQRWGPNAGDTQCAYLEQPGADEPSIFVVDADDRDCDGFADEDPLECRPDVFLGRERARREEATCLTTESVGPMACVLGGEACIDGRGEDAATCTSASTCVQPSVCAGCANEADPLRCMSRFAQAHLETTRIACKFFIDALTNKFCPGPAVLSQRLQFLPNCNVDAAYVFHAPSEGKWIDKITASGLTFSANKPTLACDFKLEVAGEPNAVAPVETIVSVPFQNGRSVAVPISIELPETDNCADPAQKNACRLEGDLVAAPSLVACVGAKIVEPW